MSDASPHPRPPRVVLASVLGSLGCAILIGSLFGTMGDLRSSETRESLADLLADPPLRGSGLSVDQMVTVLRGVAFVSGALAAAGFVLAVFVAQRHHAARIGFAVVAALLLLTVPVAGPTALLTAAAAVMMWSQDVRAWFAGEAPPARPERSSGSRPPERRPDAPSEPSTSGAPGGPAGSAPPTPWAGEPPATGDASGPRPAAAPFGSPAGVRSPYAAVPPPADPAAGAHPAPGTQPAAGAAPSDRGRRPGTVTAAVVLALLGSLLGLLAGTGVLIALAVRPDLLEDAIRSDDQFDELSLTLDQVVAVMWGMGAVLVLWSLAALALAAFTLRRSNAARVLLAVSSGMAALVSLVAILSGVAVITLVLGVAVLVLLFSGGANAWFAGRERAPRDRPVNGPGQPW